jgi:hypothetical protein
VKNPFDPVSDPAHWNTWQIGYEAGIADGRMLERRALRKELKEDLKQTQTIKGE